MKNYKLHILGFIAFLASWTVGSAIFGIVFGDVLERYTGAMGFVLGIYFWCLIAIKKTPSDEVEIDS